MLGALIGGRLGLAAANPIGDIFASRQGVAVILDFHTRRVIASHRLESASLLIPPGSTIKPFVLLSLLELGRLPAGEKIFCSGKLSISGRNFNCTHPELKTHLDVRTALAYSCNSYVAKVARRFSPRELSTALSRFGFQSSHADSIELQALGDASVKISPLALAQAYQRLAALKDSPITDGLEDAVEYGTAQNAKVPGVAVAGKTGTTSTRWAWFAGFAPSRAPKVVVSVAVVGNSGGADAAPIAGKILGAYFGGKL
jgi:cell division protein FtsI/penicillin-binding protein 2